MNKRMIRAKILCSIPEVEMMILVPEERDDEEYIDEFFCEILNDHLKYNVEWDFID